MKRVRYYGAILLLCLVIHVLPVSAYAKETSGPKAPAYTVNTNTGIATAQEGESIATARGGTGTVMMDLKNGEVTFRGVPLIASNFTRITRDTFNYPSGPIGFNPTSGESIPYAESYVSRSDDGDGGTQYHYTYIFTKHGVLTYDPTVKVSGTYSVRDEWGKNLPYQVRSTNLVAPARKSSSLSKQVVAIVNPTPNAIDFIGRRPYYYSKTTAPGTWSYNEFSYTLPSGDNPSLRLDYIYRISMHSSYPNKTISTQTDRYGYIVGPRLSTSPSNVRDGAWAAGVDLRASYDLRTSDSTGLSFSAPASCTSYFPSTNALEMSGAFVYYGATPVYTPKTVQVPVCDPVVGAEVISL